MHHADVPGRLTAVAKRRTDADGRMLRGLLRRRADVSRVLNKLDDRSAGFPQSWLISVDGRNKPLVSCEQRCGNSVDGYGGFLNRPCTLPKDVFSTNHFTKRALSVPRGTFWGAPP